jgi:hypothetical protein
MTTKIERSFMSICMENLQVYLLENDFITCKALLHSNPSDKMLMDPICLPYYHELYHWA